MKRLRHKKQNKLAVDTETTGLIPWIGHRPFALSAYDGEERWWWEWEVNPKTRVPVIPPRDRREVRLLLASRSQPKLFFNAAFDILMLESIGVQVKGKIEEVSFKARAVDNLLKAYSLKPLVDLYFNDETLRNIAQTDPKLAKYLRSLRSEDQDELHAVTVKARRIARTLGWNRAKDVESDYWMPETLWKREPVLCEEKGLARGACKKYGVKDAERTWWLDALYDQALDSMDQNAIDEHDAEQDVRGTYEREVELLPTTIEMERKGVCIRLSKMHEMRKLCQEKMDEAAEVLQEAFDNMHDGMRKKRFQFNPRSTQQVSDLLFSKSGAGLEVLGRTEKGAPKTGAEFVLPYKHHPIVRALLQYRSNSKAESSFFAKYEELSKPLEGHPDFAVLHPGFKQWGTLTGRYTCSNPNLQQVSDPTTSSSRIPEFMVNIREVFVPRPGCVWYCPDYDQLEVIIFADVSGEPTMLDAIRTGKDIHRATANKVWGGEGNPRSLPAVARVLELAGERHANDPARGMELLEKHDWSICDIEAEFGVKVWRKVGKTVTFTKIFGGGVQALMSWLGLSLREAQLLLNDYGNAFPLMQRKMEQIEAVGKAQGFVVNPFGRRLRIDRYYSYRAVNYVVQSAAADLMKLGMTRCAAYLKELDIDARIAMTIHDELVFEFRKQHAFKSVLRGLCERMADHRGVFSVATPVSMDRVVTSWANKEKVEIFR